jgi:Arc/MetJ-type ribon-helix-helix transcriptional regulator
MHTGCITLSDKKEKTERTSLRDRVLKNLVAEGFEGEERDVPVVARMNRRVVETLDSLVAVGIFKSRSEAAAALVEGAISSREDLFDDIRKQAASLSKRQDEAMKQAQEAILGKLE